MDFSPGTQLAMTSLIIDVAVVTINILAYRALVRARRGWEQLAANHVKAIEVMNIVKRLENVAAEMASMNEEARARNILTMQVYQKIEEFLKTY